MKYRDTPLRLHEVLGVQLPVYGVKDLTNGEPGELWLPDKALRLDEDKWQVAYTHVTDPAKIRDVIKYATLSIKAGGLRDWEIY